VSVARYASEYIARGLAVVPVVHAEKRCVTRDWQHLCIGQDDVRRHFGRGPQNVGILLGEPSGGVVDVDLDVPEAAQIAEHFLPPTVTSGRDSSPQSHWFLRTPGITSEKWKDIDGKVLVEVRSTGCQTIVEPSVHPSGESCRWTSASSERVVCYGL
jgi:putative DNA primase/helicase